MATKSTTSSTSTSSTAITPLTVGKACQQAVAQWERTTKLPNKPVQHIPTTNFNLGRTLGRGQFCDVREISIKKTPAMVLVMKEVSPSVKRGEDRETLKMAAVDLAVEAKMLNALNHKNIVRFYGASTPQQALTSSYVNGRSYRIYLERLSSTVENKLNQWQKLPKGNVQFDLPKRLATVALPVASAMAYLHSNNIIYRDLKPNNMGFSKDGVVKLFDFGFSKQISSDSEQYHLTGQLGTPAYMAPEVSLDKHKGQKDVLLKADVYSFAILLFEVSTLQVAFGSKMSTEDFQKKVVRGRTRPKVADHKDLLSSKMRHMMEQCWSASPKSRPDFVRIVAVLEEELKDLSSNGGRTSSSASSSSSGGNSLFSRRMLPGLVSTQSA